MSAEKLLMIWSGENSPPFVIDNNQGILPTIGNEIAAALKTESLLLKIPRKRFEQSLISGQGHLYCKANPSWFSKHDDLLWSVPIHQERNVLVTTKSHQHLKTIDEFKGLKVATTLGYRYSSEFESAIKHKHFEVDVGKNEFYNIKKIDLKRVDAAIVSDIIYRYYQSQNPQTTTAESATVVSTHDIQCVVSRKIPFGHEKVLRIIKDLVKNGTFQKIFSMYDPAPKKSKLNIYAHYFTQ